MRYFLALLLVAFSANLQAAKPCGGKGQRPCTVFERVPSCDHGLKEDFAKGICVGTATIDGTQGNDQLGRQRPADCGRLGQRPCNVSEFVPSCESNLLESHGQCHSADQKQNAEQRNYTCGDGLEQRPCNCGAYMQRPCNVAEAVPSCERQLVERNNRCEDPNLRPDNCGNEGQRACMVHEWVPSCEGTLVEANGRCQRSYNTPPPTPAAPPPPAACGAIGQRPCRIDERVPSCDAGLKEDFLQGRCVR